MVKGGLVWAIRYHIPLFRLTIRYKSCSLEHAFTHLTWPCSNSRKTSIDFPVNACVSFNEMILSAVPLMISPINIRYFCNKGIFVKVSWLNTQKRPILTQNFLTRMAIGHYICKYEKQLRVFNCGLSKVKLDCSPCAKWQLILRFVVRDTLLAVTVTRTIFFGARTIRSRHNPCLRWLPYNSLAKKQKQKRNPISMAKAHKHFSA